MRIGLMQFGLMLKIQSIIQAFFQRSETTPIKAPLKLYQSIHKLPLSVFIDCLVDHDYEKLVIEGEASTIDLVECFNKLYVEYIEAAGGRDAVNKLSKMGRLIDLRMTTERFAKLLATIEIYKTKEIFELLYLFPQYNPPEMEFSIENMNKVVKVMVTEWKSDLVDLSNLEAAQPKEDEEDNKAYSHEYFMTAITGIEQALKITISENVTVGKFCAWVVRYKNHVRAIELQNIKSK